MQTLPSRTDLSSLDKSIDRAHKLVSVSMFATLTVYMIWFWLLQDRSLSDASGAWGEFGDFIGGVLNPLVAYSAFYWLTQSVRLQKEELQETRAALEASATAQKEQAVHAQTSVRLSALTAMINSISSEVQTQRIQLQFLLEQLSQNQGGARLPDGTFLKPDALLSHTAEVNKRIAERMTERYSYEEEIRKLITAHRDAV